MRICKTPHRSQENRDLEQHGTWRRMQSWSNAIKYTGDRERGQVEIVRLKYSIESYVYELIIPKGGRMEGKSWNASSKGRGCDAPFRWL